MATDAEFGDCTTFRRALHRLGLPYAVGLSSTVTVFPGTPRLAAPPPLLGRGRPRSRPTLAAGVTAVAVRALAALAPARAWRTVAWRNGTKRTRAENLAARAALERERLARMDPAATCGTVTVDIVLEGALPKGARPDLTIDGTIELERLADVVFVGRPAVGEDGATIQLFRLDATGHARRVAVTLGRMSASAVEVRAGLQPGDQVVLSDMAQWDDVDRVRIK